MQKKALEFDVSPSTGTKPFLNPEQPGGMEKKEGGGHLKAGDDGVEKDGHENISMQAMQVDHKAEDKGEKKKDVQTIKDARRTYKKRPRVVDEGAVLQSDPLIDGRKRSVPEEGGEAMEGVKRSKCSEAENSVEETNNTLAGLPKQPCQD